MTNYLGLNKVNNILYLGNKPTADGYCAIVANKIGGMPSIIFSGGSWQTSSDGINYDVVVSGVDLDGYYGKEELGSILDGYSSAELPPGLLDGYYSKEETSLILDDYYTAEEIGTILDGYSSAELPSGLLDGYYTSQEVDQLLVDYYTAEEIGTILDGYSSPELPPGLLDGYYTSQEVDQLLVDYYTVEEIGTILDGYTAGTGSGENFNLQFDNADLDAFGNIVITHSLGTENILSQIFDDDGYLIMPDELKIVDVDSMIINVASFQPIIGNWNVVISSGGGSSSLPVGLLDGYVAYEQYPHLSYDDGVIAWWKLNETSGTTIFDSVGSNDLSFRNTPTLNKCGKNSNSVEFGVNSGLWGASTLNPTSNAASIAAWIRPSASTGSAQYIVMKGYESTWGAAHYASFSIYISSNEYSLKASVDLGAGEVTTSTVLLTPTLLNNNTVWFHVGTTFDGSNIRIYLNGDLGVTTPASGSINWGTNQNWVIGNCHVAGTDRYFSGRIEDVRICNVVKPLSWFRDLYLCKPIQP